MPGLHAAGAFGFKVFLIDSGVPEFPPLDQAGLREVMARAAELGSLVLVHAEDAGVVGGRASRRRARLRRRSCARGPPWPRWSRSPR